MNWSERLQLAGMVFGMVFVAPAVLASIEMSKPYAAGASYIQLYWPKSAVYALTFTVLIDLPFPDYSKEISASTKNFAAQFRTIKRPYSPSVGQEPGRPPRRRGSRLRMSCRAIR